MINATTALGRALQRVRLIAKLQGTEKFLREHNRHDDADAIVTAIKVINDLDPDFTVNVEVGGRSVETARNQGA